LLRQYEFGPEFWTPQIFAVWMGNYDFLKPLDLFLSHKKI
jgi:hypothetical protein